MFKRLRKEGRCGFIAYVTCGDPDAATTVAVIEELEAAGADCIELGIPFSDPIADGPVIQAASHRALQAGMTVSGCLEIAAAVRERSEIPIVAFSYLNPILRHEVERFADEASEAGVDAVLVTDLPPESANETRKTFHHRGLHSVFLLAPTSPDDRVKLVGKRSGGFTYYVSTTGVTGTRRELDPELVDRLDTVRGAVRTPLAVGFGVSDGTSALRRSRATLRRGGRGECDRPRDPRRSARVGRETRGRGRPDDPRGRERAVNRRRGLNADDAGREMERLREAIDRVDEVLVKLLNQRAKYAIEIGEVKAVLGMEIYLPEREKQVLANAEGCSEGPLDRAAVRRLFERIIDESRRCERESASKEEKTPANNGGVK